MNTFISNRYPFTLWKRWKLSRKVRGLENWQRFKKVVKRDFLPICEQHQNVILFSLFPFLFYLWARFSSFIGTNSSNFLEEMRIFLHYNSTLLYPGGVLVKSWQVFTNAFMSLPVRNNGVTSRRTNIYSRGKTIQLPFFDNNLINMMFI